MCGLFGFSKYGNEKFNDLSDLTNSLAEQSATRGTDATGVAFNRVSNLNIFKDSKSAYRMTFKHPDDIHTLIGHTRHSTQGSEKKTTTIIHSWVKQITQDLPLLIMVC